MKIKLDKGLTRWVKALAKVSIFGSPEETAIYMLRSGLIQMIESRHTVDLLDKEFERQGVPNPNLNKQRRKAKP